MLNVKTRSFTAFYSDGSKYSLSFWRDGRNGWMLRDHQGYVRTLENTWHDSVPRIRAVLENYGLTADIS